MKRRQLLKSFAASVGTFTLLPDWANAWTAESIGKPQNLPIVDEAVLSSIASTFIPEGQSEPGAVGLDVDKFLNRLFADCYESSDQEKLNRGIEVLNTNSQKYYNQSFASCTQSQRETILAAMETANEEDGRWFYKTLRSETIRGYVTSQYVMENKYNYQMTHSFYDGCAPL